MKARKVKDVDIILDKGSELFSEISDAYLRKALIRNKGKTGVESIIQTIQEKQDYIRSLPKEKSFIVQGCAGSGKTMVLLHRLRYLLYNRDIRSSEYLFLVPGQGFKGFIDEISRKFNINKDNVLGYQEYYQKYLGKLPKNEEQSELVFDSAYLERIYSKDFIRAIYRTLFKSFSQQIDFLIEFSESKLNELLDLEKSSFEQEILQAQKDALSDANKLTKSLQEFTSVRIGDSFEYIDLLLSELQNTYNIRKTEYLNATNPDVTITIAEDDERVLQDDRLLPISESIKNEQVALSKASIFTVISHKNKLKKLQEKYSSIRDEIIQELIEKEKALYKAKAAELVYVYDNVTLTDLEKIISALEVIREQAVNRIMVAQDKLENLEEYLGEKFADVIEKLNHLIDVSAEALNVDNEFIEKLIPSYDFFENTKNEGRELLNLLKVHISTDEMETLKERLTLFSKRTESQMQAYLNTLLFNACKKKIQEQFDIIICDAYKHYWYLALYCNYLSRPLRPIKEDYFKYIFVDEAQDLSVSELELISKLSAKKNAPIMNLFGDTNQVISTHGIKKWSDIDFISELYTLEENFRNTNQVVDYCNNNLIVKMVKIGVDMQPVNEYNDLQAAIRATKTILNNAVFIVKDDYAVKDLTELLASTEISNYEIYTVKNVKGLEFKEVFIFETNMSHNEKYISYTRALVQLNVIKRLPETAERGSEIILQGSEEEENFG